MDGCEGQILTFSVDLDDIPCPSCTVEGSLCLKTEQRGEHTVYQVCCMSPTCHQKRWLFVIALKDSKPTQWQIGAYHEQE